VSSWVEIRGHGFAPEARSAGPAAVADRAKARAGDLAPFIAEIKAAGATTYRAIAAVLNERRIPTARARGNWSAAQFGRVLALT
jgi:hypothetical protein